MPQFKTTVVLPEPIVREIGRLILRHAELENRIAAAINELLGIGQKKGRVAIPKAARLDKALGTLLDLAQMEGRSVPLDMSTYRKVLGDLSDIRNAIAHGRWLSIPGEAAPSLQIVRNADMPDSKLNPGQWSASSEELADIVRRYDGALDIFLRVRAHALGQVPELHVEEITGTLTSADVADVQDFLPHVRLLQRSHD